jgi:hypothetical protein
MAPFSEPAAASARQLPPLILHPFSDPSGSAQFLENSKASLMLSGLLPSNGFTEEELTERVLRARYLEIRMLYFVGKDLSRWIGQCVEWIDSTHGLEHEGIREQSFAAYLTANTPAPVQEKLRHWGVYDFASIFMRALGLHTAFAEPPAFEHLSRDFILNYHRYADFLFACYQQLHTFTEIAPGSFDFELYGSGEYSRMLESQWGTQ